MNTVQEPSFLELNQWVDSEYIFLPLKHIWQICSLTFSGSATFWGMGQDTLTDRFFMRNIILDEVLRLPSSQDNMRACTSISTFLEQAYFWKFEINSFQNSVNVICEWIQTQYWIVVYSVLLKNIFQRQSIIHHMAISHCEFLLRNGIGKKCV